MSADMSKPLIEALHWRGLLVKAIEEKGEGYVYPRRPVSETYMCRYVLDGKPSCLIGHAMYYNGDPLAEIAKHEGRGAYAPVSALHQGLDWYVIHALQEAQGGQDVGETWGSALRRYDQFASNHILGYEEAIR